jgi:hypothetical protein
LVGRGFSRADRQRPLKRRFGGAHKGAPYPSP